MTEDGETNVGKELVKVLSSGIGKSKEVNLGMIDRKKKSFHVFDREVDEEKKEKEKYFMSEIDRLWELDSELQNGLPRTPGQPRIILVKSRNEDLQQPINLKIENVNNELFLNTIGDSSDNIKTVDKKHQITNRYRPRAIENKIEKKQTKKKIKVNIEEIVNIDDEKFELASVFKDKPDLLYTGSSSRVRLAPIPMNPKIKQLKSNRKKNTRGIHHDYNPKKSCVINMINVQPTDEKIFQKMKALARLNKTPNCEEKANLSLMNNESLNKTDTIIVESETSKDTSTVHDSQTKVHIGDNEETDQKTELESQHQGTQELTASNLLAQTKVQTFSPEKEVKTKCQTSELESPNQEFQQLTINNLKAHERTSRKGKKYTKRIQRMDCVDPLTNVDEKKHEMPPYTSDTNENRKSKTRNIVHFVDGIRIRSDTTAFKDS